MLPTIISGAAGAIGAVGLVAFAVGLYLNHKRGEDHDIWYYLFVSPPLIALWTISWFGSGLAWMGLVGMVSLAIGALLYLGDSDSFLGCERKVKVRSRVRAAERRYNAVIDEIARYRIDLDLALATPALENPAVPTTRALLEALSRAEEARSSAKQLPSAYEEAVADLERAFNVAVEHAHRVGDGSLRARARGLLRTIIPVRKKGPR